MNFRNPTFAVIGVSIIAALAILAASALLEGQRSAQMATYVIIAVWWIPFSILVARRGSKQPKEES